MERATRSQSWMLLVKKKILDAAVSRLQVLSIKLLECHSALYYHLFFKSKRVSDSRGLQVTSEAMQDFIFCLNICLMRFSSGVLVPDGYGINIGPRAPQHSTTASISLAGFLIANDAKSGQSPNYTILAIPKQKKD